MTCLFCISWLMNERLELQVRITESHFLSSGSTHYDHRQGQYELAASSMVYFILFIFSIDLESLTTEMKPNAAEDYDGNNNGARDYDFGNISWLFNMLVQIM